LVGENKKCEKGKEYNIRPRKGGGGGGGGGRAAADQVTVCRSLDLNCIPSSICRPTYIVDHIYT